MISEAQLADLRARSPVGHAALFYARAGFPVFPCRETADKAAGSKRPYTEHGWKDAVADEAAVLDWWSRWPKALIGFPTGPASQTLVVDIDVKGAPADAMLAALRSALGGRLAPVGGPAIAKTQGDGLHLYYAWPDGTDVTIGVDLFDATKPGGDKALNQVDWRGAGGYVIAPPSAMANGAAYEWIVRPARDGLRWRLPAPPATLMARIEARRRRTREPANPQPVSVPSRPAGEGRTARYVEVSVRNILDRARTSPEGARNAGVFAAALKLGNFVRGGFLSRGEAEALLLSALPTGVHPGEHKIRVTIANGLDRGVEVFSPERLAS